MLGMYCAEGTNEMIGELIILNWFRRRAREGRAREDGDRVVFAVTPPARLFFGGVALVSLIAEVAVLPLPEIPLWGKIAVTPIVLLALWQWPSAVVVDSSGVSRRNVLGVRRTLAWNDVRALDLAARRQEAHVVGTSKFRIAFTAFHIDLLRFVEEVRRRAPSVKVTSDL